MQTIPDDLDKLLVDVKKTIDDNLKFLKTLSGDVAENEDGESDCEEVKEELFEEL